MSLKPKQVDFDQVWMQMQETIEGVITLGHIDHQVWNDRFTDVYSLCVACPEPLGERLYMETKQYLDRHVKNLLMLMTGLPDGLLKAYHKYWIEYSSGVNFLNNLFTYLNTHHVKKPKCNDIELQHVHAEPAEQMFEMGELGMNIWKTNMIEVLCDSLVHLLLEGIKSDRLGDYPNHHVFHGVIHSFVHVDDNKKRESLEFYETIFETPFLNITGEYARREASKLLQENNCSQYMEKVLQLLDEENLRSRRYLHPSSYSKVSQECEQRMVGDHLQFLHGECKRMVEQECRMDLQRMYKLLKSTKGALDTLINEIQQHITKRGLEAINGLSGEYMPQMFVEPLLDVHGKYLNLIKDVFSGDQQFLGALDKAFAAAINFRKNPKLSCRSPELLAKYCDSLLKKNTKGISELEVEDKLTQSITIFKYIDDKDVFQKFYAKMLAKRLIYVQSISMDAEESMINKLKLACGYEFTGKLHRMYTDVSVSSDLNSKFLHSMQIDKVDLGINFSIAVLQAGAWPLGQSSVSPFIIPQNLEKSVQKFEDFYNARFSGRKLTWLHHLCHAELKLCYLKKSYIVTVSTYQMALLLLYQTADRLSYCDMKESTNLNDDQLSKQVQSLLDSKLLTACDDEPMNPASVFCLNMDYSNKRIKFKITAVTQKEAIQREAEQTHASVDEDRKLCLQAGIVRIMKARRVIRHNTLVEEVINLAKYRFLPSISMIKKCIEALIDKQYIERTPHSSDEYNYGA